MEEMGGAPPTFHSHAQQVETIGVGSLTSSEIYFICTNFSAITVASENWECKTAMNSKMENKFWVK